MNLVDLLNNAGGKQSLGALAGSLGLDASKTDDLVSALAPALTAALAKQKNSGDGLSCFKKALATGKHQEYLKNPDLMSSRDAVTDGNSILGHLLGSKETSRNVAAQAVQLTGIDENLIKQALPLLAGLAMGAVSKSSDSGNSLDGSVSDLLGGLLGGGDGIDVDDVLSMAKKFF